MFIPVFVKGTTLDDTWFQLLKELRALGREYPITDGSYAGQNRLAFDFVSGIVMHPHARPLAPITDPLDPPTTDDNILNYFNEYLMNPNLEDGEEYRYAQWINGPMHNPWKPDSKKGFHYFYDETQVEWVIRHFKEKGFGNEHCFITIGDPTSNFRYDKPYKEQTDRGTSPCLRGLDFRVVDGYLTTHVVYRSWDLVGGWPENMGGFTLLNEYVANMIGAEPGPLSFSCKSLHAYDHAFKYLDARIGKGI